jgi:CDP-diacylglycerol---serine O-phosphatidyltransferase
MVRNSIPNIFTLTNLALGLLSILMTFDGNFKLACLFILFAGVLDRYDGRVARLLKASSELGKELDSLADLVSFGVAPSILVFSMYNFIDFGPMGYVLVLLFPLAGAYRLARYNCSSFDGIFMGVPITAAGSFIAFYSLLSIGNTSNTVLPIIFILLLSYLMVSKLKIRKV